MQGFNMGRYVPPEYEGTTTGNKLHKKKPPGVHGSTMTVRFEMPFNIFCGKCEQHIAQGVRFNAEKKKVGNYYSTAIYAFRMKHIACGNTIEIRTDPKNTAYEVAEGGKKQATAEPGESGALSLKDSKAGDVDDPFAKAEKAVEDKTFATTASKRLSELQELNDRQWEDPYEHSRKLRKIFREERKRLESKEKTTEAIRDRNALHIPLLDETPEDDATAKLVEFNPPANDAVSLASSRPLFSTNAGDGSKRKRNRLDSSEPSARLGEALRANTRSRIDPFLHPGTLPLSKYATSLPRVLRKSPGAVVNDEKTSEQVPQPQTKPPDGGSKTANLVGYGSESDSES